ncbi:hypothetical protein CVT26_006503 [Gymnopilus dilepis]|uniref:Uncharacterized protein n=1 Tax=Gymnopilus dilepis TaxID=231916 RepID=A0A409W194_9AGAR|nr:hypothetical protein CVT26_006503 [Gymnopilus dilepis]
MESAYAPSQVYLMPKLFRPYRDGLLQEFAILGVALNWKQIRRLATVISQELVEDDDQAYDIVAFEIKVLGYELCSLYETDPDTPDSRPLMMFAVQDTIYPDRWGAEHRERSEVALAWLAKNGCPEACDGPLERTVIGLRERPDVKIVDEYLKRFE